MTRILLVEDDVTLSYGMEFSLKNEGFEVTPVTTLSRGREAFKTNEFSLILLDLQLPDGSGYDLCKEVRETSDIPIIFLTAHDEEVNVVLGLDLGGDDYITKPFRIRELISRIKAILRRSQRFSMDNNVLKSGDLEVSLINGTLKKNGIDIILTALEYRLLLTFMKNPNQILSRSKILEGIWDIDGEFVDDNTLSVYIRRIREKIEDNPSEPGYIVTARGIGYRWNMDVRGNI